MDKMYWKNRTAGEKKYLNELKEIKEMMSRSSRFISLSEIRSLGMLEIVLG